MAEYEFEIRHIEGKKNVIADYLSFRFDEQKLRQHSTDLNI